MCSRTNVVIERASEKWLSTNLKFPDILSHNLLQNVEHNDILGRLEKLFQESHNSIIT